MLGGFCTRRQSVKRPSEKRLGRWAIAGLGVALWLPFSAGCVASNPVRGSLDLNSSDLSPTQQVATPGDGSPQALYDMAVERWQQDDEAGCEQALRELLEHHPNHRDGQMLAADLYAAQGRAADAERDMRELLRQYPRDAQIHHSLGLLLESNERPREALACYANAVRLAPENELYALSLESLRPAAP